MKNGIVNKAKMRRRLFAPLVVVAMLVAAKYIPVEWVKIVLYVGAFLLVVGPPSGFTSTVPCATPLLYCAWEPSSGRMCPSVPTAG